MTTAASELYSVFDARRVKAPELKGLDIPAHAAAGWLKNHQAVLPRMRKQAAAVEALEPEIQKLTDAKFREEIEELRVLARLGRLEGDALLRAFALAREAAVRTIGKRPFLVQIMGAMVMQEASIAEMATGEGKTLTAAVAAGVMALSGKPVHIITVNDYPGRTRRRTHGPALPQAWPPVRVRDSRYLRRRAARHLSPQHRLHH